MIVTVFAFDVVALDVTIESVVNPVFVMIVIFEIGAMIQWTAFISISMQAITLLSLNSTTHFWDRKICE